MIQQLIGKEKEIFELAKPYLTVMNNELHTKEVVKFSLQLLSKENGGRHIVIPAAILHDIGWSLIPETKAVMMRVLNGDPEKIKIHEEKGALLAEGILEKARYDRTLIDEIVLIIQGHDTRKHALSQNDKIVKDADKLSRFSKKYHAIWPRWRTCAKPYNYIGELKKGIKEWFFLKVSRKIAEKELQYRLQEIKVSNTIM